MIPWCLQNDISPHINFSWVTSTFSLAREKFGKTKMAFGKIYKFFTGKPSTPPDYFHEIEDIDKPMNKTTLKFVFPTRVEHPQNKMKWIEET